MRVGQRGGGRRDWEERSEGNCGVDIKRRMRMMTRMMMMVVNKKETNFNMSNGGK